MLFLRFTDLTNLNKMLIIGIFFFKTATFTSKNKYLKYNKQKQQQ